MDEAQKAAQDAEAKERARLWRVGDYLNRNPELADNYVEQYIRLTRCPLASAMATCRLTDPGGERDITQRTFLRWSEARLDKQLPEWRAKWAEPLPISDEYKAARVSLFNRARIKGIIK